MCLTLPLDWLVDSDDDDNHDENNNEEVNDDDIIQEALRIAQELKPKTSNRSNVERSARRNLLKG